MDWWNKIEKGFISVQELRKIIVFLGKCLIIELVIRSYSGDFFLSNFLNIPFIKIP